jgi:hypothetical protein
VIPVGLGFGAHAFDEGALAIDAEQLLDEALGLLVAALSEMLVAHDAVRVDEVQRGPIVVVEGPPDLIVVIDRNRVVDLPFLGRPAHALDVVLEGELGSVHADDDQPVVAVGPRPPTDVGLRAQPVDARKRPEIHEHYLAPELRRCKWPRVQPRACTGE